MTRSVLVTGASKGIGAAIAATLGGQGFTIVVHYRSDGDGAERTAEAVRAAGGDCRLIQFDVTDRPGVPRRHRGGHRSARRVLRRRQQRGRASRQRVSAVDRARIGTRSYAPISTGSTMC